MQAAIRAQSIACRSCMAYYALLVSSPPIHQPVTRSAGCSAHAEGTNKRPHAVAAVGEGGEQQLEPLDEAVRASFTHAFIDTARHPRRCTPPPAVLVLPHPALCPLGAVRQRAPLSMSAGEGLLPAPTQAARRERVRGQRPPLRSALQLAAAAAAGHSSPDVQGHGWLPSRRLDDMAYDFGGHKACSNCGTTVTPMWRKGPEGPATLCNACGVRCVPAASPDAAVVSSRSAAMRQRSRVPQATKPVGRSSKCTVARRQC